MKTPNYLARLKSFSFTASRRYGMKNSDSINKPVAFFGIVATLILTSCASLSSTVPNPTLGTFTQEELNQARRIRNDPRLYGVELNSEQYTR
jgi:hypothetical protein